MANEDDNTVTIIDLEKRVPLGEVQVGVEPEGMGISPDGKILVNTSETTNMAHFIDTATRQIVANVLVDARPRFAEFKRDGSEVWVSSEVGGTVSVIDPAKREVTKKITFEIPGLAQGGDPAGRDQHHQGRQDRLRRARPGQPRRRHQRGDPRGAEVSSRRPARLAHGVHPGREISSDHQRRIERRLGHRRGELKVIKSIQVGELPWGYRGLATVKTFAYAGADHAGMNTIEPPAAAIEGVSLCYGTRQALDDVTVSIAPSTFAVLLGLNGAGRARCSR